MSSASPTQCSGVCEPPSQWLSLCIAYGMWVGSYNGDFNRPEVTQVDFTSNLSSPRKPHSPGLRPTLVDPSVHSLLCWPLGWWLHGCQTLPSKAKGFHNQVTRLPL